MEKYYIKGKLKAEPSQRFINYIIDLIVRIILFYPCVYVLSICVKFTNNLFHLTLLENIEEMDIYFLWVVYSFTYFSITESFFFRTISKFITKTNVVTKDGSKPTFKIILIRTLIRFIPIIDFVSFLYTSGLHDYWSKTIVVKTKEYNEDKEMFNTINEIGLKD